MTAGVQAVERALALLEEIAASRVPQTAPEIAARAGINRATSWRLLRSLERFDLVERDHLTGRYSVSYGILRLATATNAASLIRRSRPVLERLAAGTDGSAFLEVAAHGPPVVVDEVRPPNPILVDLAHMEVPLHCGSVGKLYLASLPDDEREAYLRGPLEPATPWTIVNADRLREVLDRARASGIATNYKEHREEWCGISAVIRDRAGRDLAYLNLTLPTYRWSEAALRDLGPGMLASAEEIETLIGARRLAPEGEGRDHAPQPESAREPE